MPRRDEDDDFEDDRPRRRKFDEDDEPRSRNRDEIDGDVPLRRRPRDDDEYDVRPPRKKSMLPLLLGIGGGLMLFCCVGGGVGIWMFSDDITGADDRQSGNNLKQLGIAIHSYHDRNGTLPSNTYAQNGKPLLSWRVHILPRLGRDDLYRQFNLAEPWDGPTNRPLLSQMPIAYGTPAMQKRAGDGKTYYRGFSHDGAIFQKPVRGAMQNRVTLTSISDGTSNTILVVEAGEAVEWTKPDDLDFGPGRPLPPLGAGRGGSTVQVLMCDGSVRKIRISLPESTWRALISYQGGEVAMID